MPPTRQFPGCMDSRHRVEPGTSWIRCRVATRCSVPTVTEIHSFRSSLKDTEMSSPVEVEEKRRRTGLSQGHISPTAFSGPWTIGSNIKVPIWTMSVDVYEVWIMSIRFDFQNINTLQEGAVREAYGMFCTQPRRPGGQWRLHTDAPSACKYKRFFSDETFNTFWCSSLIYYALLEQSRSPNIYLLFI
jgi:hypothetical protein